MKIILASPFTSTSGSAIRFWNLARQFKANGFEVIYTDRNSGCGGPLFEVNGIDYRPSRTHPSLVIDILRSTVFTIALLLRNLDCRVFYALKPAPNNCCAALLARLLGKKVILDIDDLDYAYLAAGPKRAISEFFFRFFPRFFPVVTCHTPALLRFCKEQLGIRENRLYYLAQGVSDEFLAAPVSTVRRAKSIIYVATLGITSDFDDLLPLLAGVCGRHPDASVTVVGDGVRRAQFEANVCSLGLAGRIVFRGKIPHDRLPGLMAEHRIGLNYMRKSQVNDCRAILKIREYLACGLQVVCNDCGDAALFSTCALIEPDLDQLERRLDGLLAGVPEVNAEGRRMVQEGYSWERIVTAFLDHLRRAGAVPPHEPARA